ncbi:serine hydrolase domain-containing protein [Geodermatophilus sp. SYSU D01176]
MRTRRALLSAAMACAVAACAPAPAASEGPLQGLLDRWRDHADVPAVVMAVQQSGAAPWIGVSGTTERDGSVPATVDARFRIASITKTFVAVVVLQLVEEERLRLDDPVSGYSSDLSIDGVTVRHLLTHTSGIPDYSTVDGFGQRLLDDRERRWDTDDLLALIDDLRRDFRPGTAYAYSNTNYLLLGSVINAVTGSTWAAQVRARILDPLGLRDTYIAGAEPASESVIAGYFDADNDGDQENIETDRPWMALETSEGPAGAIVSTAADLVTFGEALFRGDLVSRSTLELMVADQPFHPRMSNYGLGIEIARPDYRTVSYGHGGFLPGFRSVLWYVPSRDALVVVLANDSLANPPDLAELAVRSLPPRPRA